ncbi:MAG: 16S rRNA (cytosine(1402)-N(4))-methyltransferase RsmH [Chloroflexi bacterium]|nr:16S rRNA (cytosine(1402)-N(4))-methyltransferase RsmH [Chloroflexota bacterium]
MGREGAYFHRPVMVKEVLEGLGVRPGGIWIDSTVGEGGHSVAILESTSPGGRLLGMDLDPMALERTRRRLSSWEDLVTLVQQNFRNLEEVARERGFLPADGVVIDLGMSSLQLEGEGRGFSFREQAELDMRFDPRAPLTAHTVVNTWSERDLTQVLARYGEEPHARQIARAIVRARPVMTAAELADIVARSAGWRRGRLHPATRSFQALRIAVNQELENLELGLNQAINVLRRSGRLVVLSYHSLEDRTVKEFLRQEAKDCLCPRGTHPCQCGHRARLKPVYKKVVRPSRDEIRSNPRSRSARLRVAERI